MCQCEFEIEKKTTYVVRAVVQTSLLLASTAHVSEIALTSIWCTHTLIITSVLTVMYAAIMASTPDIAETHEFVVIAFRTETRS